MGTDNLEVAEVGGQLVAADNTFVMKLHLPVQNTGHTDVWAGQRMLVVGPADSNPWV